LRNARFLEPGEAPVCAERAATLALLHDVPEVLTGDLPTPVKYHSEHLRAAYKQVEESACASLLALLPEDLRGVYVPLLVPAREELHLWSYVKAADKLSALIKCMEERKAGNCEFKCAEASLAKALWEMHMPEVDCFMEEFLPAYERPLDEMM
jgi:5'-deoxynucleotidase